MSEQDPAGTVALAYLHPGHVQHAFMASVLQARMRHPGLTIWPLRTGANSIPRSRNLAVRMLLDSDKRWLWFVDTDIGFPPTMLENMLALAGPERPVITAIYLAVVDGEPDGMGGYGADVHPAVYEFNQQDQVVEIVRWPQPLPDDQLIKVGACGAGMLLIARDVLDRVGPDPFDRIGALGEDLSFCFRLRELNIPIHAHTGLITTHTKMIPLR